MQEALHTLNDYLWTYLIITLLLVAAGWFTFRTGFVQFRYLGEMWRLLVLPAPKKSSDSPDPSVKPISSFQAFAVSVASRVGTGNLAGVATAIYVGGPGAVFWMWFIALFGAATAFVESTLAQLYKRRVPDGFIGGPAYYIKYGLKKPWMGALFSILIALSYGCVLNALQSNTIAEAFQESFSIAKWQMGLALSVLTLLIVFGGIHRVARVVGIIVPVMAVGYILLALGVLVLNIHLVPTVFRTIFESAFGIGQFAGGAVGVALMQGIRRGLFSNEAGLGSAPNAAATATVSHPVNQGLIQALGVFTDTLVICSCTAFIILLSGASGLDGIRLTQQAFTVYLGEWGGAFVAFTILAFAYSTILGNYFYGETNVRFFSQRPGVMYGYRFAVGAIVMGGALSTVELVWSAMDLAMACMAFVNLIAIFWLGKYTFKALKDYRMQKRAGIRNPKFHKEQIPEISEDLECW